jgi:hypothetical protein
MSCTVRFLSDQGAGIDVSNSEGLPNRFDLVIKSDGLDRACRVVAQNQRHIDIALCAILFGTTCPGRGW